MTTNFDAARAKWPNDVANLPAEFQAVYQTRMGLRVNEMAAVASALQHPIPAIQGGRYIKTCRARDLTLIQAPLPAGTPNAPAVLTAEQIERFGLAVPAEGPRAPNPTPAGGGEIAELRKLVQDQQIAITKLLRQQEALAEDKDATSAYEICSSTLDRLPTSFRGLVPMSRVDRRRLRRDHGGSYPQDRIPKDLQLPDDVKNEKNVASAKITLVALTKDIVSPLMDGNLEALRMVGTVHSRIQELRDEVQLAVEADDDIVLLPSEVLDSLEPALGAVTASMDLVLDLHARLRTTVTSRIERAMGFVDLHDDPNKRSKETFLSEDFQDKIEAKAKEKAHMAWAKTGSGAPPKGSLHGQPPPKRQGGGGFQSQRQNGGRDRGGSNGGRGRGRGSKGSEKGGGRGDKSSSSSSNK